MKHMQPPIASTLWLDERYLTNSLKHLIPKAAADDDDEQLFSLQRLEQQRQKQQGVCIIIKSAMGTGKTALIKAWCANRRVLAIGSRVTHCTMLSSVMDLVHYQSVPSRLLSVVDQPRLVIQLQSIRRLTHVLTSQCIVTCSYDVVVLEEFVTLCQELQSPVTDGKMEITRALINVINIAPVVIVADANLTNHHTSILQNCLVWACRRSQLQYHIVDNVHRPLAITVRVYDGGMSMSPEGYRGVVERVLKGSNKRLYDVHKTVEHVEDRMAGERHDAYKPYFKVLCSSYTALNDRAWKNDIGYVMCKTLQHAPNGITIVCATKTMAKFVYCCLTYLYRRSKVIGLVTGDECINVSLDDLCDASRNAQVLERLNALIYTTKLSIGVDLTTDRCADYTFLLLTHTRQCPPVTNMLQSVGRVRRLKNLFIYYTNTCKCVHPMKRLEDKMMMLSDRVNADDVAVGIDPLPILADLRACETVLNERTEVYTDVLLAMLGNAYTIRSCTLITAPNSVDVLVKNDGMKLCHETFRRHYAEWKVSAAIVSRYLPVGLEDLYEFMIFPAGEEEDDTVRLVKSLVELVTVVSTPPACWRLYKSINWRDMASREVDCRSILQSDADEVDYMVNLRHKTKMKLFELYTNRRHSSSELLTYSQFDCVFQLLDTLSGGGDYDDDVIERLQTLLAKTTDNIFLLTDRCLTQDGSMIEITPCININWLAHQLVCCT